MSFDDSHTSGPTDDLYQKTRDGGGRSLSPNGHRSPQIQTSGTNATTSNSTSPLTKQTSQQIPSGSPPPPQSNEPVIDPSLLDADGEPENSHTQGADKTDAIAQGDQIPRVQTSQWQTPLFAQSLHLQTSRLGGIETQPPSSSTDSPATPIGLTIGGIYASQPCDMSRQSSMTDLSSYVSGTKGISTYGSSESGYDMGGYADVDGESEQGVPPPKQRKSHARKQPVGHIKRARNAFILFRKHVTDTGLIPASVEVKHQNISVVAAKMWREAPQEVRQKFQEQARLEKEEHQRRHPGYRYQPVFRRTDIIRRRVRKDVAEDEKVEAVAEALIKGKAKGELEKEIKGQMSQRSEASESDAEGSSSRGGSRRRRNVVGQLSKGAIRAQRAQARAKQMRQSLLGSNLLNMSIYNAQASHARTSVVPHHPGAQYAMAESYIPVGYELDGRPIMPPGYPMQDGMYPGPTGAEGEMYRLPPIEHGILDMGYGEMGWQGEGVDYYGVEHGQEYEPHPSDGEYYHAHAQGPSGYAYNDAPPENEYRLPPLLEGAREGGQERLEEEGLDPRMREWARDGQQTPSGHVLFNERLFDGALGSAGLQLERRDDGLVGFDEAIAQANEVPQW